MSRTAPFRTTFAQGRPLGIDTTWEIYTVLVYNPLMHVIAKTALVAFWRRYPDAESSLRVWYHLIEKGVFKDFNALKVTFASVDYVGGLTVFDIGGNKYRLIASIHYNRHKVYIRAVLTHAEYDRGRWKEPGLKR